MLSILAAVAAASVAAPLQKADPVPSVAWVSHWGDSRCWLIRSSEEPAGSVLALSRRRGSGQLEIEVVDPRWTKPPVGEAERIDFVVEPGRGGLTGKTRFIPNDPHFQFTALDRARMWFSTHDRSVEEQLASATFITVVAGDKHVARATLPNMTKAMNALRSCESDALKAWGIDPAHVGGLRSSPLPVEDAPPVITVQDYPARMMREGGGGKVVVRLSVDETGKVRSCAILETSGQASLDRTTCALIVKRGQYHPAVNTAGEKVAADYVTAVTWAVSTRTSIY